MGYLTRGQAIHPVHVIFGSFKDVRSPTVEFSLKTKSASLLSKSYAVDGIIFFPPFQHRFLPVTSCCRPSWDGLMFSRGLRVIRLHLPVSLGNLYPEVQAVTTAVCTSNGNRRLIKQAATCKATYTLYSVLFL